MKTNPLECSMNNIGTNIVFQQYWASKSWKHTDTWLLITGLTIAIVTNIKTSLTVTKSEYQNSTVKEE